MPGLAAAGAILLVASLHATAALRFPPSLTSDSDRGTWIMQEADRIGLEAIAAMRRQPLPRETLRQARAALQELVDPCVKLGRRACADGLTYINYYTEQIDTALRGARRAGAADDDGAYRRTVDAKRLPPWEHEMMLVRRPWVGMSDDLLRLMWGSPDRINRATSALGSTQQWWYGSVASMVTVADGYVSSITQVGQAP